MAQFKEERAQADAQLTPEEREQELVSNIRATTEDLADRAEELELKGVNFMQAEANGRTFRVDKRSCGDLPRRSELLESNGVEGSSAALETDLYLQQFEGQREKLAALIQEARETLEGELAEAVTSEATNDLEQSVSQVEAQRERRTELEQRATDATQKLLAKRDELNCD